MKKGNSPEVCLSKFFKVYLAGESGDDLELPISFNSCLPKTLPKYVIVKSIYGKTWKLALRKSSGDIEKYVLVNGWKRIAKDENLTWGDFFLFEFDGSRCFNFCIYEHRTRCKRLGRSSVQTDDIKEESDGEEDDDVIVLDDDSDDDDSLDADDDVEDDDATVQDDDDVVEAIDANDDEDDDADADEDSDQRLYLDGAENPSFTATLNSKKIGQLLIPTHVIKDYGLNFPESITLVDPLEHKFGRMEKKIKIQNNGSVFVKGFGSVMRRNNVNTTDEVVCEIKKAGNNNLVHTIKIYVIRG